jgi:N-acetyl-alpha-D-glucosaminyl L-malate synthase BshA
MICYASVGGSGVLATELALALALRDHEVHLFSSDLPFRWPAAVRGLSFERVHAPDYPLFGEPQYLLALANALVRVAHERRLDILHAHYAVPHATAAFLAHEILLTTRGRAPRTVTTLHGTDITLVGSDPSYAGAVGFSIQQSHGVTAVSESLKSETVSALGISRDIRVVPNFLDCGTWRRTPDPVIRERWCPKGWDGLVVHISNFRPVKRVDRVLDIFKGIRERVRAKLVLIGDGPDRSALEHRAADEGLGDAVEFVGEQLDLVPWLSAADLFLLPSAQESFGMAALEAMACEVPVVASRVGGLPEVITDGVSGYLRDPDDVAGMIERSVAILTDAELRASVGTAACERVRQDFCSNVIVPAYEAYYEEVLASRPAPKPEPSAR